MKTMKWYDTGAWMLVIFLFGASAYMGACRWGGAKIQADVPIYGNALIDVAPVEIDGAPAPDDPQAD